MPSPVKKPGCCCTPGLSCQTVYQAFVIINCRNAAKSAGN